MKINEEIIEFFKEHNLYDVDMFWYFNNHISIYDYIDEDQRMFIGCAKGVNKDTNRLESITIGLPYIYDDITKFISINVLLHAIMLYNKLGKKYHTNIDDEALPMMYGKLYANLVNSDRLNNYVNRLDSMITEENKEHYIGLEVRDELLNNYNNDPYEMKKLSKKLTKKYQK